MKQREILLLFFIIFCLTMQAIVYAQGASKVEIYFNAATEEYLRSNFSKAAENLEKALELKAENKKIKDFLVKILYEAGEYFYLKRNYHSAYNYLEKAKKYAPENKEIDELYNLVKSLVGKFTPESKEPTKGVAPKEEIKKQPPLVYQEPKIITKDRVIFLPAKEYKLSKREFFFLLGFLSLFFFLLLLSLIIISLRFKKLKKDIATTTQTL
ncbi:MAG TPA: hypothetical protein DHV62_02815, partial [Elusimicrobia bacterium]|nr:hypothetical protein [Elusimicrobiota bacterium]